MNKNIIIHITIIVLIVTGISHSTEIPIGKKDSLCKSFGWKTDFAKSGKVFLPNPCVWGESGKNNQISYRKLKMKGNAELLFAAFNVDAEGFCQSDMILEVFYQDNIKEQKISATKVKGRVVVKSRIDFSKKNEYVEIGSLEAENDGEWKIARFFLSRNPRQQLRAIDGSFQFNISMPNIVSKQLPVSYIRLFSVRHPEFVKLREKDRAKRGLVRIDYKSPLNIAKTLDVLPLQEFVVYPVNYLHLVFPNSPVNYSLVNRGLECFEVPGKAEPVSFVIHTSTTLSGVKINISDLHFGNDIIPSNRIEVRMVVFNDQRWGWGLSNKYYGTCPDYLSAPDPCVDINANTNRQFWLTIDIPENAKAGLYTGQVILSMKDKPSYQMPLSVEVLPIKLFDNKVKHIVYHSPFYKDFHKDRSIVLQDMKKHGLVPVLYPKGRLTKTHLGDIAINLEEFKVELKAIRKAFPDIKTVFIGLLNYNTVWAKLNGPEPRYQSPFPLFESTYKRILLKYAYTARSFGMEPVFSFADEPTGNPDRRRIAYLCSSIARKAGLKTWVAAYINEDKQLPLSAKEIQTGVNYLRPLSEVLDVLVYSIFRFDQNVTKRMEKYDLTKAYYTTYLCTMPRPVYNRFLNGLFPFIVDAEYVSSYAYRDSLVDQYDDLDFKADRKRIGRNDYLLTYSTWSGDILPTLPYEALREGIEDSELISTLQVLADKAVLSGDDKIINLGKESKSYLEDIFKRLHGDFRRSYFEKHEALPEDPMENAILSDLDKGQDHGYEIFDKIRRGVCDRIMVLQNVFVGQL